MTQIFYWGRNLVSYEANETISAGDLVTVVAGPKIEVADADEHPVGVALEDAISGEMVTVALPPADVSVVAAANVTAGDAVIPAANGEVQPWDGSSAKFIVGVALETKAADNRVRILLK